MLEQIVEQAKQLQEQLIIDRRTIHEFAEVGMDLENTCTYVKTRLSEIGYDNIQDLAGGVVAIAGADKAGKVMLLRADMDALPIPEETGLDFAAQNGNAHACGHDLHTAMLLGAAKILKDHESELSGPVKLMFQPGEEILKGAQAMIDEGILENPSVDAAVMIHVTTGLTTPAGLVIVPPAGVFSSASDSFYIKLEGQGGHGASPNETRDPINAVAHLCTAIQTIISREMAGSDNAVISFGHINGGSTLATNVIPDDARLNGTIRTYNETTRQYIFGRIEEIAQNVAATFRTEVVGYDLEEDGETVIKDIIDIGCPSLVNDVTVVSKSKQILKQALGAQIVPDITGLLMPGSEDFAFVTEKVPGLMIAITAGQKTNDPLGEYNYPNHNSKANFDEAVLWKGAATYASIGYAWLLDEEA